ncbi:serine/alanine racemase [Kordia sp. SMS9]|uniref:acyltransferase family protein n=1 Tax=Kordia sp. SMS9 TaxID=2282170 RepID=UPI000E106872|nr:acyltransferase family protein [Kordia sp. SMS9]AXG69424.1 serine/alanine racemase [Kordia sp. SMS9]
MDIVLQSNSRNILIDILKVIASLLVVAFHCNFLYDHNKFVNYLFFKGIFRPVIPFFFCVSGFFLYTVFQKGHVTFWAKRVAILYVVWMLVFSYFWVTPNYNNPFKLLLNIVIGFNHLWYVASLLVGGLLLYAVRKLSNKTLLIGAIILYCIGYFIQMLGDLKLVTEPEILVKLVNFTPTHRNFLLFDLPFLALGYMIRRSNFHKQLHRKHVIGLLILSLVLLTIESLFHYYYNIDRSLSIICLSCFIAAPVLLLSTFSFSVTSRLDSKLLSLYSIAIYLVHPLIVFIIRYFVTLESISLTLTAIILSIVASYFLIQLNKKLKYIL